MRGVPALTDQLAQFLLRLPGVVVVDSRAANMSASGGLGAWSQSTPRPHLNEDSGTMPAIASFVNPHVSRISRKLPPS